MTEKFIVDEESEDRTSPQARQPGRAKASRRWVWRGLVAFVGIGALGGGYVWFTSRGPQQPVARTAPPIAVVVETVDKDSIPVAFDALGTVTALAVATVRAEVPGQLLQVAYREGERVGKGRLLAQVDPQPYQFAVSQAEGQLRRDAASLLASENDLRRYRTLASQNSIPKQQAENQEQIVDQQRATIVIDEALLKKAKLDLTHSSIVAPFDGRVGLRQVDIGNYVQTNDANGIVVLTQTQPITVVFSLSQDKLPAVARRWRKGEKLSVALFDPDSAEELARGELTAVDNQIDTATGTVKLRAEFANEDEALFPNQFVNVRLVVDVLKDAAVVPISAIQHGAPGDFVFVVKPDDSVSLRTVRLGPAKGQNVAALAGVAPGDRIVVDGADRLREGARVVARKPPPPRESTATAPR